MRAEESAKAERKAAHDAWQDLAETDRTAAVDDSNPIVQRLEASEQTLGDATAAIDEFVKAPTTEEVTPSEQQRKEASQATRADIEARGEATAGERAQPKEEAAPAAAPGAKGVEAAEAAGEVPGEALEPAEEMSDAEKAWSQELTRSGREDLLKTTILGDQSDRISRISWNNLSERDREQITEALPEFEVGGVKLYSPEIRGSAQRAREEAPLTTQQQARALGKSQLIADREQRETEGPTQEDIDEAAHEAATSPENELPQPTQAQKEAGPEGNYKAGDPVELYGVTWKVENPAGSYRFKLDERVLSGTALDIEAFEDRVSRVEIPKIAEWLREGDVPEAFKQFDSVIDKLRAVQNETPSAGLKRGIKALEKLRSESWFNKMPAHYARAVGVPGADGDSLDAFLGLNAANQDLRVFVADIDKLDGKGYDESKVLIGFNSRGSAWNTLKASYDAGMMAKLMPKGIESLVEFTPEEFQQWVKSGQTKKPARDAKRGRVAIATEEEGEPETIKARGPEPSGEPGAEVAEGIAGERPAGRLPGSRGEADTGRDEDVTGRRVKPSRGVAADQGSLFDSAGRPAVEFAIARDGKESGNLQDTERDGRSRESRRARRDGSDTASSNYVISASAR